MESNAETEILIRSELHVVTRSGSSERLLVTFNPILPLDTRRLIFLTEIPKREELSRQIEYKFLNK